MSNYKTHWDLGTIPQPEFESENGRRRRAKGPRAPNLKLEPCKHCGEPLSARQRQHACFKCGRNQIETVRKVAIHGTYSFYVNQGCRCDDCKLAARNYRKLVPQ